MKKITFIIIIIISLIFLYGKYIEINNFKTNSYTIKNDNIPESFKELKIVHFSDILYGEKTNKRLLDKLSKEINSIEADVIIFSGDLLKKDEKYNQKDYKFLKDYLKNLDANLYKYAVIGDNDETHLEEYKDILYESDFVLLDNESTLLFYKDLIPINIIGLTNIENVSELLISEIEYSYTLAITHKPDYLEELSNYEINTILSGHSLGGIVNIPYYGGIIKTEGAKTYINNSYELNNTELFISNGIGFNNFNFRLLNTPSINVYRFSN